MPDFNKLKKAGLKAWLDKRSIPYTSRATNKKLIAKIELYQAKEKELAESPTRRCRGKKYHTCEIREDGISKFFDIVPGDEYDFTLDEIRRFTDPALPLPIVEVIDG